VSVRLSETEAPWLYRSDLQRLLVALAGTDAEARVVGGAIRNTLLAFAIGDIDIATTTKPDETVARIEAAGFRAVPTGIAHGTVTAVTPDGASYEITTLREDIATDGRHAQVRFGTDWQRDGERRDFTINAVYASHDGVLFDPVGGLADINSGTLRFIGKAEDRIAEDYLRILRFFRFFAWYGSGRPDAEGLKACAKMKSGLGKLSVERVWSELRKTLSAPDPARALLWMRQASVLTSVLPESEKWGIDAIPALMSAERDLGWPLDPLLRLLAVVPPDPARLANLAKRLKMAGGERDRLTGFAMAVPITPDCSSHQLAAALYRGDPRAIADRLRLDFAVARAGAVSDPALMAKAAGYSRLLDAVNTWQRPDFPVSGRDLVALGHEAGPQLGKALAALEDAWIDARFKPTAAELLAQATKPD
jgi:tRNA nucleotidyltransferase/poly(A) polymerase